MKMNITIDMEEFHDGEDSEFGSSIETTIINQVSQAIQRKLKIEERMEDAVKAKFNSSISDVIDKWSLEYISEYIEKEVCITDGYGEKKFQGTIKQLIHRKFDSILTEKVDKNGDAGRYGADYTRAEYLIKKILDAEMKSFTDKTVKEVKASIKSKLTEELELSVGKGIIDSMGINKIIDSIKTAIPPKT